MSEIPRATSQTLDGIPRCAKGYSSDDFLFFQWTSNINPNSFKVILEDLAGRWVGLGPVQSRVLVPNTYFAPNAMLIVAGLNKRGEKVRYIGTLSRGNMYVLYTDSIGDHTMQKYLPQYNL